MDDWNRNQHTKSGLWQRVLDSTTSVATAEAVTVEFLSKWIPANKSPICGNSICQDRRFLARWMPALEDHFHYRNLDVSTLKELARRWRPEALKGVPKEGKHEALADVLESIEELKHYREQLIRTA
jgi:oligoribonuclease